MKKMLLILFHVSLFSSLFSQSSYFPPLIGNTWDTLSPDTLTWCPERLDSLHHFLDTNHTKGFIILKDGKIVVEWYYGNFTQDSLWYWASAGKSLTSFLIGKAQEEGFLSIYDTTLTYLDTGWTSCSNKQEEKITILNQLTMTTGLDDGVADDFCTLDTCLVFKADAGTRWAYHNAPYSLLKDVLENATGTTLNAYTQQKVKNKIGMGGLWYPSGYNTLYFSNVRSMARYGLLIQNRGIWNTDTLLHDENYFQAMTNTSQNYNLSYGYLWWLNGKASYMLPQSQYVFSSPLIPSAPNDLIAALGKNDQKIYVVPSENMVVVRMGESSGIPLYALSNFDELLWQKIRDLNCSPVTVHQATNKAFTIYPNPAKNQLFIKTNTAKVHAYQIHDISGHLVQQNVLTQAMLNGDKPLDISSLKNGVYFLQIMNAKNEIINISKIIK